MKGIRLHMKAVLPALPSQWLLLANKILYCYLMTQPALTCLSPLILGIGVQLNLQ